MEKLREFAGVIVAVVTVTTALASLGLWAIHVQINPEIRRLDGRLDRIDGDIKVIRDDIKTILLRLPNKEEAS